MHSLSQGAYFRQRFAQNTAAYLGLWMYLRPAVYYYSLRQGKRQRTVQQGKAVSVVISSQYLCEILVLSVELRECKLNEKR